MGKPGIPEYFSTWAVNRHWRRKRWKCRDVIAVMRVDGVPVYTGRAYCLQWSCPQCQIKLMNILTAKVRQEPVKAIVKVVGFSKAEIGGKLAKIKRKHKAFEYKRLRSEDAEWILARDSSDV